MLLAIDIGNTNLTLGVFDQSSLRCTWRISADPKRLPDEYAMLIKNMIPMKGIDPDQISAACICSVAPSLTSILEQVCKEHLLADTLVVSVGVKTGIRNLYDNPKDVGADRIVDAVAALKLYGGPVIVVDFGTATVFDAISSNGDYLGGAIAPGVNVSAESLFLNTSQLRRVELVPPKSSIGRDTVSSLQSGLLFGHVAMVEGMVTRFKQEIPIPAKVIATGGLAPIISKETDIFDAIDVDLTLTGLRIIYDLNITPSS